MKVPKKVKANRVPFTTKHLHTEVLKRIEGSVGYCTINSKWQLQIRGKDLRRLLKKDPRLKCLGRIIILEE
jgi:hypothetical protein